MKPRTREILTMSLVLTTVAALVGALIVALREPPRRSAEDQRSEEREPVSLPRVESATYSPQATLLQPTGVARHTDEERLPAEVASRARPWNDQSTEYGSASSTLSEPKKVLTPEEIQSERW